MIELVLKYPIHTIAVLCVLGAIGFGLFYLGLVLYHRIQVKNFAEGKKAFPNEYSKFCKVGSLNLHYISFGMGEDVILLHGLGANVYCWRHLIPLLSKKYRVWAVDLKGFGCSDKPLVSDYGRQAQAQLILDFAKAQGLNSFNVVGNSMGGAIALEMALIDPIAVKKVVLINSAHDSKIIKRVLWFDLGWLRSMLAAPVAPIINRHTLKPFLKVLYGKKMSISDADVDAYLAPYMTGVDSHRAFAQAIDALLEDNLVHRAIPIASKVLILWGERDRLTPLKFGKQLHRDLPGSQLFSHAGGGHHLQEEEPEWVFEKISEFLA